MDSVLSPGFTVHKITENLWRFNEGASRMAAVDAYLAVGEKRAALIDTLQSELPGSLADAVRSITALPVDVLITHGHPDHAGAETRKLAGESGFRMFMNLNDLPIAQRYAPWLSAGVVGDIREGDVFDLGDIRLDALRLAGHTPGSMVFLDRRNRRCFTGDALGVWLQLDHSLPMAVYLEELKRLEKALFDIPDTKLWTGHSVQAPDGFFTAAYVTQMREACQMILEGKLAGQTPRFQPHLSESPVAAAIRGAKIAQHKDVKALTYREDRLFR